MSGSLAGLLQIRLLSRPGGLLPAAGRLHGPRPHLAQALARRARPLPARAAWTATPTSAGAPTCAACSRSPRSACCSCTCCSGCRTTCCCPSACQAVDPRHGVEHRRVLRHQHQLAVLLGRDDDGLPGPDGGPGGAELRVRRRRHRGRDRADPRLHRGADRPARATSGWT